MSSPAVKFIQLPDVNGVARKIAVVDQGGGILTLAYRELETQSDPAWNGTDLEASEISLLKGLFLKFDQGIVNGSFGLPLNQTYVPVPAFDQTQNTIVQIVAENANRKFLSITNNGDNDAELWFGARPVLNAVTQNSLSPGQSPPRGSILFANGGSTTRDLRGEKRAIFANAVAATGLSVLEG